MQDENKEHALLQRKEKSQVFFEIFFQNTLQRVLKQGLLKYLHASLSLLTQIHCQTYSKPNKHSGLLHSKHSPFHILIRNWQYRRTAFFSSRAFSAGAFTIRAKTDTSYLKAPDSTTLAAHVCYLQTFYSTA